ncbi:MAG: leucine-rich repeat domain-containing protein [Muribaculaceae bacterium]|nr:leucine-rich repeat domain-containing protein [Muribaculaceae bacterium]
MIRLEIPKTISTIGRYTFYGCRGLASILWIPEEAEELCKLTEPWCNFSNIKPYNFTTGVKDPAEEIDEENEYEVFNINGVKVADSITQLKGGVYILRQGNKNKKIVIK